MKAIRPIACLLCQVSEHGIRLLALSVVTGSLLIVAFYWRAYETSVAEKHICVKVDHLDQAIIGILENSRARLPKIAYFREHPAQLVQADRQSRQQIATLRAAACDAHDIP